MEDISFRWMYEGMHLPTYPEVQSEKNPVFRMCWTNMVYTGTYRYIQVHTSSSWYTHTKVTTTFHFKSGLIRLATPASFPTTLEVSLACSFLPLSSLLDCQTTQAGLAAPKLPQPWVDLIDIAAPPSVSCSSSGAAEREAWILALAEHVWDCWSGVTSYQKTWDKGGPAHHVLGRSHVETRCMGWFVQLDHPIILNWPLDGQRELLKCA